MQSGKAKTDDWLLEFEPEERRTIDPLMGYTSSGDMKQQLRMKFPGMDDAVAYCRKNGIPFTVQQKTGRRIRKVAYSDNFRFSRTDGNWTH